MRPQALPLTGLLTTAAALNTFERGELARVGCVILSPGSSSVNVVEVQRQDLVNLLNLGFVEYFQPFHDGH
jgi:hypothetical protein